MQTYVYTTATVRCNAMGRVQVSCSSCSCVKVPGVIRESASDDETVMLSLRVPTALKDRLATVSAEAGVTIQSIGRRALEVELEARQALLDDAAAREASIRERVRAGQPHPQG